MRFPAPYRAFLAAHDGWTQFRWGMSLYSTAELTRDHNRGYLEEMEDDDDDQITEEMRRAVVIGWSENDILSRKT